MVRLSLTVIALGTLYATSVSAIEAKEEGPINNAIKVTIECEKNLKVTTQADLDSIKSCKAFKGTIEISQMPATQLKLEGVEQLVGDLIMTGNSDLQSFSAPELQKVQGQIKIENHTVLSKADFPKLTEATYFSMSVLPALENINFPAGLTTVKSVRFEDTRAPKIEGFKPETIESFTLLSNNYMRSFDFNSVKEVTGDLLVLGNNHAMTFDAAQLSTLQKATFFNLNQLDAPKLTSVKDDISFHENEFTALNIDTLTSVGGTMTIANNNRLTELSFKNLTLINGALSIGNNSQLASIEGFPVLSEIHGMADLAGSFDIYSLPALQDVRGGMRLQTTSAKLGCSDIERKLKGDNIVKGNTWSCSASMQESNMVPTVGQTPSTSDGKSGFVDNANKGGNSKSGNSNNANTANAQSSAFKLVQTSSLLAITMGLAYYFY